MSLPLTPELLQASYEFLCCTPPFKRWKMPPGETVKFKVTRSIDSRGHARSTTEIGVSSRNIGRTDALFMVMAHEMVHIYLHLRGLHGRAEHPAEFWRCARLVCKHHGFDIKMF